MAMQCKQPFETGRSVAIEFAIACGDVDPRGLSYAPIGAMRGKTVTFGGDTGDTTTDSTVGDFRETGMLFKTFEFSGDGLQRRDDGIQFNQTQLKMFWINTSQPMAWFRFTMPDITVYAYMLINGLTLEFPYDDYMSYSIDLSATASDFGVIAEPTPVAVTVVNVTPATASIVVSGNTQLVGQTVPGGGFIEWASSNEGVATVSASGLVVGVGTGTATITATSGGVTGSAEITVAAVTAVAVDPVAVIVAVDGEQQLTVTTTPAGGSVTYLSDAPNIATVSPTGLVTGVAVGETDVTVTSAGVSETVAVEVTA